MFLESRYRKLVRGLPQTTFFCPKCKGDRKRRQGCEQCEGFGRLYRDSVQDLLGRMLVPAFKAKFGKFHGAGREDVDVRMLGNGRPFVFELVEPRRFDVDLTEFLVGFHDRHGERVELDPLISVEKPRVAELKAAEHQKVYRAEVAFDADVSADKIAAIADADLPIVQRTPQRVAHRRGDLERQRHVEVLSVESRDARACVIEIRCQHGTYVKEWISGDEGRTEPSLAGLCGVGAECVELDVLEIVDQAPAG